MFRNFPTETVKLIKEDDQIIEFEALFSKGKFFVEDTNLPVKEGYTLVRTLPNGFEEEYVITDTGYYPKFHNIQAHYQIEVIKKSMQKSAGDATTTVFVTNNQGKINVSSTDYSTNYYSNLTPDELFDSLREVASGLDNKAEVLASIEELKLSLGKPTGLERYKNFIELVANHITIFTPFIPFLTKLI